MELGTDWRGPAPTGTRAAVRVVVAKAHCMENPGQPRHVVVVQP